MSKAWAVPYATTLLVPDTCICLNVQRTARTLARRFDEALRPVDITNGQFSLLTALNRPVPPTIGSVARLLAMDRTTLTAALKPLERAGLVDVTIDTTDRRSRRMALTHAGSTRLAAAVPIWHRTHQAIQAQLGQADMERLCASLRALDAPL